ncbi:MAG: hypothetical protein M0036_22430 [Desulfobacteraceae bacterium]|nr:hypothetical protein [Desulfobacteraceae bacterium]
MRPMILNAATARSASKTRRMHPLPEKCKPIKRYFASVAPGTAHLNKFRKIDRGQRKQTKKCSSFSFGGAICSVTQTSWLCVHLFAGSLQSVFNDLKPKDAPERTTVTWKSLFIRPLSDNNSGFFTRNVIKSARFQR